MYMKMRICAHKNFAQNCSWLRTDDEKSKLIFFTTKLYQYFSVLFFNLHQLVTSLKYSFLNTAHFRKVINVKTFWSMN